MFYFLNKHWQRSKRSVTHLVPTPSQKPSLLLPLPPSLSPLCFRSQPPPPLKTATPPLGGTANRRAGPHRTMTTPRGLPWGRGRLPTFFASPEKRKKDEHHKKKTITEQVRMSGNGIRNSRRRMAENPGARVPADPFVPGGGTTKGPGGPGTTTGRRWWRRTSGSPSPRTCARTSRPSPTPPSRWGRGRGGSWHLGICGIGSGRPLFII